MSYITPKTTRGVQEQDVWAAADAVLAQGQRPTIERVRLQLGRGSPNTVGPMLESWFARLGERLAHEKQSDALSAGLPDTVLQAMRTLWQSAQQEAHSAAQAALSEAHAQLQEQAQALQQEQTQLQRQADALAQQKTAMEEAWRLAQAQQADLMQRLEALEQQLQQRDASIAQLHSDADAVQAQREAERQAHSAQLQAAAQERQRLVDQFSGNEKRWLTELDRSRQELEKTRKQHQDALASAQQRYEALQARNTEQEAQWQQERLTHAQTAQSLAAAQERIQALKEQLQQAQRKSTPTQVAAPANAPVRASTSLQRRALSQRSQRLGRR